MSAPTSHPANITIPRRHNSNMSPAPSSPAHKLAHSHRTSSQDSTADGIRKRVCKACDRCRLKKSKCDGSSPCSRCKADNAICVFGERKKSHDKVYPKGYVEMLEQQQTQLVTGLQEMYRRLQSAQAWDGKRLSESNGRPLTHDILAALNLLETRHDGSGIADVFEEDVEKLQSRMIADGNGYTQRRGSVSSDSEHSQRGNRSATTATPILSRPTPFRDSFNFGSNTSSPLVQSPVPSQRQPKFSAQESPVSSAFHSDPSLYAPEWAQALNEAHMQNKLTYPQQQQQQQQLDITIDDLDLVNNNQWASQSYNLDNNNDFNSYSQFTMNDVAALDSMDVDFSKFVNATATEVYI